MTRGMAGNERGVTAMFVAVALVVFVIFLALSINVGHAYLMRGQLQNASDSAALAGTQDLDGTAAGLDRARASAIAYARYHTTDYATAIDPTLIEFGHWAPAAQPCTDFRYSTTATATRADGWKFCMIQVPTDANGKALAALDVTAVRVRSDFTMDVAAGALFSRPTVLVSSDAVAVAGGPCHDTGCIKTPLVIRAGCLNGWTCGSNTYQLGLSSAPANTAGWANIRDPSSNPSQSDICQMLRAVQADPNRCWNLDAYSDVYTNNGNNIGATCAVPGRGQNPTDCELFGQLFDGKTVVVPIVSYDSDTAVTCTGPYNGPAPIKSFRKFTFVHTYCGDATHCATFASYDCVDIQLSCDEPPPTSDYGCYVYAAPSPLPPKLVE